jgi:hypothetical protein
VETLSESRFNLVDTYDRAQLFLEHGGPVGTLIIVNGPMAFCDFLEPLAELVRRAEKVIWVQQDYTIMPPSASSKAESPFRKVFADRNLRPIFWTTVTNNRKTTEDRYINWNQLTYNQQTMPELSDEPVLLYYGAYRQKREGDFKKFFAHPLRTYPVRISTTALRGKKFTALDPKNEIEIIPPFTGLDAMPACRAGLYIEDSVSHKEFHSPANRFYEMLSAGIPILFDRNTLPTLAGAGYKPEPEWVVGSVYDLNTTMSKDKEWFNMARVQQRAKWHEDYVSQLRDKLLEIWRNYEPQL